MNNGLASILALALVLGLAPACGSQEAGGSTAGSGTAGGLGGSGARHGETGAGGTAGSSTAGNGQGGVGTGGARDAGNDGPGPEAGGNGASTCLGTASSTEIANASTTSYRYASLGHAVDARNVTWSGFYKEANWLTLTGAGSGCFSGGRVLAAFPEDAVYECTPEHCPGGICPADCVGFHTSAGIAPEVSGGLMFEDVEVANIGDAFSMEPTSGNVIAERVYVHDIHDDAFESDFGLAGYTVEDSLLDRVWMPFAMRQRSSSDNDSRSITWTIRNNLVRIHRFTNSYKEKPGHEGFFKADKLLTHQVHFRVTDNVFVAGPLAQSGSVFLPIVNYTDECANNTILWTGSATDWNTVLSGGTGYPDGLDNAGRLKALSYCYKVILKPATVSVADFLAQYWDPLVSRWKSTHSAGQGT